MAKSWLKVESGKWKGEEEQWKVESGRTNCSHASDAEQFIFLPSTFNSARKGRCRKAAGFTLIEVMLALAIFGMAALAAVKAATDHLSSVGYLQDKTFARYVASNRLAELSLTTTWPPANNVTGSEMMAGKEWFWQQQVAETAVGDFRAVNIRVSDQEFDADDDDQTSIYQLSRYVGRR